MKRPEITKNLDGRVFKEFYYLKEELVDFCKAEGLQTSGGKEDITNRICHYLKTGEKIKTPQTRKAINKNIANLKLTDKIEENFVCSETHRRFFKKRVGKKFSFNVEFQKWLKLNSGKTYKDAISAYYQILENKKTKKTKIDKQFEYNTYIRDFFVENKDKNLSEAIRCWKYKKSLAGNNKYEKDDLRALNG